MAKSFGAESTADEVLEGIDLSGKRVLITGVSAGLGVETARSLVAHGATVVGTARDLTKARRADRELNQQDLVSVAVKIVPLSRTMKEQINHIRGWAFERAVRASPQPVGR